MGTPQQITVEGFPFVKIVPTDILTQQVIPFWILAEAKGGAQLFHGPLTFNLNCALTSETGITQSDGFETSQDFEISNDHVPIFQFDEYGNSAGCLTEYSIVD